MVNSAGGLDQSFLALSHPIRRGIVERLTSGPATVGEATVGFGVSKPTISKHLKVLEDAGVVRREIEGRNHRLSLRAEPLADASEWMERQRELWERKFRTVERFLDEQTRRGAPGEDDMTDGAQTAAELRLEHTFAAPREDVFDAWTNPNVLRRWWAAGPDWDTPAAEVDLREGGRYSLSMRNPESDDVHTVVGEYREVRRPERLVYTWAWEGEASEPNETVVTVEFNDRGGATDVVLVHEGFSSDGSRAAHEHGWEAVIASLRTRVLEV